MIESKLSDLAIVIMGQSPKGDTCNSDEIGEPLLNGPTEFGTFYPIPKQYTTEGKKFSEKEDILFCVRGSTTGRMNISDSEYVLGRGLAAIRHKFGVEYNSYLKYLIEYNLLNILKVTSGSTFPNLTSKNLLDFKFLVPSLPEQLKISKFLSDLDAKIDVNNKINKKLEAMAKTLYDYWFVQFDFPYDFEKGKPDVNGKPYKSSGGKMVYNEELKRKIPEGWEVKLLTDEMNIQYGFPFSTELFNDIENGVPVIRIRDILNSTISNYSTEEVDAKYKLNKGDILVGMDGNFHINYWHKENCYLNQRCLRIRGMENSISIIQVKYSIEPYIKAREKNVSRTTVAHLSAKDVNDLKVIKASVDIQYLANRIFKTNLEQIVANRVESEKLAELRDWLLPMLMNGQVRVGEAEERLVQEDYQAVAEPMEIYSNKK